MRKAERNSDLQNKSGDGRTPILRSRDEVVDCRAACTSPIRVEREQAA